MENNNKETQQKLELYIKYKNDPVGFIFNHIKTYDVDRGRWSGFGNFKAMNMTEATYAKFNKPEYEEKIKKLILDLEYRRTHKGQMDKPHKVIIKSRQMYVTFTIIAYFVWCLLFVDDIRILMTSEKADKIDKKGEQDTLFTRIDNMIDGLPDYLKPEKKDLSRSYMTIGLISRRNVISGDGGISPGRSGGYDFIFNDEFAHQEFSETKLAAEISACKGSIINNSTPKGKGNAFYRLYDDAKNNLDSAYDLDIYHWSLRYTEDWYNKKSKEYLYEWLKAQELDMSFEGSQQNRTFSKFISSIHAKDRFIPVGTLKGINIVTMDYGWVHDTVITLWRKLDNGVLIILDCWAANGIAIEDHTKGMIKMLDKWEVKYNDVVFYGDPSGDAKDRVTGKTSYDEFIIAYKKITSGHIMNIKQADNRVAKGIEQVNIKFMNNQLFVNSDCTYVIDALNECQYKYNKATGMVLKDEKYKEEWYTDACDTIRYGVMIDPVELQPADIRNNIKRAVVRKTSLSCG